jgi:hypothetical protein
LRRRFWQSDEARLVEPISQEIGWLEREAAILRKLRDTMFGSRRVRGRPLCVLRVGGRGSGVTWAPRPEAAPSGVLTQFLGLGRRRRTCYDRDMTPSPNPSVATFTPGERMYIRREFHQFFSTFPTVAEGFQLKTWRAGPKQGQPKLPPAAASLVERGLMRLDVTIRPPRLFFTEPGLAALRAMMADRRLANPADFARVRLELGIDPPQQDGVAAD